MKIKNIWLLGFGIFFVNTIFAQTEFTDQIDIPTWGSDAVDYLYQNKIISGNDDGSLAPDRTINRAEFLKILTTATEANLVDNSHLSFPDVPGDSWFSVYVHTAADLGWAQGYPDGYFRPGNTINQAEISKLLVEAFGLSIETEIASPWYQIYIESLSAQNLLPHRTNLNNLDPGKNPSRIEVFEQLYRILLTTTPLPTDTETTALPLGQTVLTPAETDERFLTFEPENTQSNSSLNVRSNDAGNKQLVNPGQDKVTILNLNLNPTAATNLIGLQLRRVGNGSFRDFETLWAEFNGTISSAKVKPKGEFVYLQFTKPLPLGQAKNLTIRSQINEAAVSGNSSRWVVFMPDWINSDANETVGLFPLAGLDVNIR